MIPGPATFFPLITAAIHILVGIYFFVGLFRRHSAGTNIFFVVCCLMMAIFAYNDLLGFPPP